MVIWTPLAQADLKAIHTWRVIYQVQAYKKFVLTLFHKRRDSKPDDIKLNQ